MRFIPVKDLKSKGFIKADGTFSVRFEIKKHKPDAPDPDKELKEMTERAAKEKLSLEKAHTDEVSKLQRQA